MHGGLRRDGFRNAIKLSVDIRERGRRLALLSRGQVLVQSSLSGVHGCLRVDYGLLAISRGRGVRGCGRRGRGSSGSGLCRKARHVDGEGDAGKGAHLVLPGVGTLCVAATREAGDVVSVVGAESGAVEAVCGRNIASRVEAGHIGRAAGDGVELLSAVDARKVAVLRDVHADTDNVVLGQHVLVVKIILFVHEKNS